MMGAGDVLVAQRAPGGRTLAYARTSGAPARWNARFLAVAAPDLLLGQPGFTPLDQTCRAAFDPSRTAPRWTVCYRAGRRPAELYEFWASATGRWLVATGLDEVVLFSGADGMPTRRIRFDDRVQYARAEDDGHFLVVLTAPNRDDGPTVSWMVRCSLRLRCQEVTPQFTALYDTVRFVPD